MLNLAPVQATPAKKPATPVSGPAKGLTKTRGNGAQDTYVASRKPAPTGNALSRPVQPPAIPIARDAAEAVTMALKGDAVKLSVQESDARGLAIRELIPRGALRAFEIGLGSQRFEIVVPTGTDAPAFLASVLPLIANFPASAQQNLRRITYREAGPTPGDYTMELDTGTGKFDAVQVKRTLLENGKVTFDIEDPTGKFRLTMPAGPKEAWSVAQAFQLWAEIPVAMRATLHDIQIDAGENPQDSQWATEYHIPGFKSAATGGNGAATFWSGTDNLREDYFLHEFGHCLGQTLSTKNAMVPDAWEEAIASDKGAVTEYAKSSPAEDFAESFWVYLKLRGGENSSLLPLGPHSIGEFAEKFPRRAAILDAIFKGELIAANR